MLLPLLTADGSSSTTDATIPTVLRSRVVVGDLQHPTPVAQARLDAIVLNPPWNIPTSIAGAEILPLLRKNPRYLADSDMVILDRQATDPFGRTVDWSVVPAQPFPFRLQQRPGPKNALGRIKSDLPNRFDVYLHDTPARSLFARPVRTASHGCIRVERALDLAAYVLDLEPKPWSRSMLEEGIASGRGQQIRLLHPMPVSRQQRAIRDHIRVSLACDQRDARREHRRRGGRQSSRGRHGDRHPDAGPAAGTRA